ncbi:uncharacterized protein LOC135369840 [Ornithodoros turicata]|uniref:uncharacterized protein LOC135369840 n=1 Tax=Ornithodoros turicata TaxID=34597 RepID=UPI0031393F8F
MTSQDLLLNLVFRSVLTAVSTVIAAEPVAKDSITDIVPQEFSQGSIKVTYGIIIITNRTILNEKQVQTEPSVAFNSFIDERYSLIMLDVESHYTHWLKVNMRGGDATNGDDVQKYHSPAPDAQRTYLLVVFRQNKELDVDLVAATLKKSYKRVNITAFPRKYSLGNALGSTYFTVIKSTTTEVTLPTLITLPNGKVNLSLLLPNLMLDNIVPTFLPETPQGTVEVEYPGGRDVRMGTLFAALDLGKAPIVRFTSTPGQYYTLILSDIDAKFWRHWLVINIANGNVTEGDVITPYVGPVTDTRHRYLFLLYRQREVLNVIHVSDAISKMDIWTDFRTLSSMFNLGAPVAVNYFAALCKQDFKTRKTESTTSVTRGDAPGNTSSITQPLKSASSSRLPSVSRQLLTSIICLVFVREGPRL